MKLRTVGLALALAATTGQASAQQVLQSVHASVSLSVGYKGAGPAPDVVVEVTQPGGKMSTATARAAHNGERSGRVNYPDDFSDAGTHTGTYRWRAMANGKVLSSGRFEYQDARGGSQVRVPF